MHLHENALLYLDLGVKVTQDVAQYPLHHVTYSNTKFEVARSNSLGGDAFTKNTLFDLGQGHTKCCPVTSSSCELIRFEGATSNGLGGDAFT